MTAILHDHHDVHNDLCPQNDPEKIDQDCTCQEPTKRKRNCGLINRAKLRRALLDATNSNSKVRIFTQVYPSTLDEAEGILKHWLARKAENPPRLGKTL